MIGQTNNIQFIDTCISNNKLPRFMLIRGDKGSGKKELVNYISQKTGYSVVFFSASVESVRNLINLCYQQTKPILYVIPDCEKLSIQAENALLKVAEEPPTNAYIILTVNDDSLLPTIKSRGTLIVMEEYTNKQKEEFATTVLNIVDDLQDKVELSTTLGDLIDIANTDYTSMSKFCNNIINNIDKANIGSALTITKKLKLKEKDNEEAALYDLHLFIKVLLYKYHQKCLSQTNYNDYIHYFKCWDCVFEAKRQLQKNINKQYVLDNMVLKLREVK